MSVTWVLEPIVMPEVHDRLRRAARARGDRVVTWNDDWWSTGAVPRLEGDFVVFHGSLQNADRIVRELPWQPGAFCNTGAFACSAWYPEAGDLLVHRRWRVLPADELVEHRESIFAEMELGDAAFVRPDSPLKPFSGRTVSVSSLSLAALDHGFHYEDEALPVVVAPVQAIGREWRYIVSCGQVVAGSAYQADGRSALPDDPQGAPWAFAQMVAETIPAPDPIYVLDVCEAGGRLRLLELNPFSGADLYACDAEAVAQAVLSLA